MYLTTFFHRWVSPAIAALVIVLVAHTVVLRPGTSYPGSQFNRNLNAVWLGVEWVHETHSAQEITNLANNLAQHQVAYVFAYTSYMRPGGQFNDTYGQAGTFIRLFKAAQPGIKVLAWIGLPLQLPNGDTSRGEVNLADEDVRKSITAFSTQVINIGFDGVHLNAEPVMDGDGNLLELLTALRQSFGSSHTLSIATHHIRPILAEADVPSIGPVWSALYYRQVARRVDQIALMTYDSTMPAGFLYRFWTRLQVLNLSQAIANNKIEVLIGVPTSEEPTVTHWPMAENMANGVQGVIDGLNDLDANSAAITGIAVYPHWQTDVVEWETYDDLWLGKAPEARAGDQ
jgi:spore germination protein YaaH